MFQIDDRSHFRFGIVFELSRLDFLITAARFVASVLQGTDFRFGLDLDFFRLDFHIAATRFVRGIL